jgi:hypothetical protein
MIPLLASLVSELGTAYCVLLPLSAVVASWLVARRARVPAARQWLYVAAILLPFWVGVIGTIQGVYVTLSTVSNASPENLGPVFLLNGVRMSLMTAWVGLLLVAVPFFCAWVFDGRGSQSAAQPELSNAADSR